MKKNYFRRAVNCLLVFCLSFFNTIFAQDPPQYATPFAGVPDQRDAVIYQVNMRAFSSTHNFQGVINRLDQIKALGTNVIYLMPVFPVGTLKSLNSPYCIKDFQSVGSEFGSLTDLRTLVDGAHNRNMAVILDWVVNQTSWDHPWITQHPDWYLKDGSGNITGLNGYTDVAALNFSSTAMRTAMISAMRSWVFTANVDGFRCDFADNPPIDFWQQAITSLRGITTHHLLLLAEGTRSANYGAGFDYNFGMQFYNSSLRPIFSGGAVTAIDNSNTVEYSGSSGNQQIVRYLTNHDVDGSDGAPVTLFGGKPGSMAAFVVVAYMKGVPFIYNGQEVAFPTAITFPFTSVTIDWTINPDVTAEYTKVVAFRNSSNAIRRGTLVSYTNNDVCAFTKTSGTEKVAVFSNLRNGAINYALPAALQNTTWKDAYSGAAVTLGTTLSLAAYQYRVLTNANADTTTPPATSFTVHFYKPTSWGSGINIYWWSALPAGVLADGSWPGVSMTNAGNGWYTYTFTNISSTNLIFNDGTNQTANLSRSSNGWYLNGVWYDSDPGTPTGTTYYQILNRWQPNTYLYDGGNGQVKYGTSPSGNTAYQWAQVDAGSGYVYLRNRGTGNYMYVENQTGYVQCGTINTTWYSAMWSLPSAASGWNYIQNRWQTSEWVHIENLLGYAQYSGPQTGWYSAEWQFTNPVTVAAVTGAAVQGAPSAFNAGGGADSVFAASVRLFPNPAHGGRFSVALPAPAVITICDQSGKIVLVTNLSGTGTIDHAFPAGIYFVRIRSGQIDVTKKLVVN